ncbi:MAG: hypothetical protein HQL05_03815 [Nitrospirae bacterium]|uniref:hypothetical protein n=1 Tax=Candidatus Magnetobacterium casense TaxID=1455061 RepID=UPI00059126AB|nr:hypothetical protein [Candidatus Magnetobacterium casensis]MBF0336936.1 hypothetical protein [Nitrospirota bacterium]
MQDRVILDANILVGLYDNKDSWHKQANELIYELGKIVNDLIILDCVANETFTVLSRRLKERKGVNSILPIFGKLKMDLSKEKITTSYFLLETDYNEIVDRIVNTKGVINFHDSLDNSVCFKA